MPNDVRAALAAYDLVAGTLAGREAPSRLRECAYSASPRVWTRLLGMEGCAEAFRARLRASGRWNEAPAFLQRELDEAAATSIRHALSVHEQLSEVAALAQSLGIRVLALKGAARLLGGDMAGARSIADIDLLVTPGDVHRFHSALQSELAYQVCGAPFPHHAAGLSRHAGLGLEIHWRLSAQPMALDEEIWRDARPHDFGSAVIQIPSPTGLLLHTLEHAAVLNWDVRYRLRDILDVADTWTPEVVVDRVIAHIRRSPHRPAFETLLSAAKELNAAVASSHRGGCRTVRRVARARIAAAMPPRDRFVAMRLFRYAGVMAEGSPLSLWRAGRHLVRRIAGMVSLAMACTLLGSCAELTHETPVRVPSFVFASRRDGASALFAFRGDSVVRLSQAGNEDDTPRSAAGRIVFMSRRDGDAEVYVADADLGTQQRLTVNVGFDGEPALDPAGTTIAFVSSRSGTRRIWLMDVAGANGRPLATGSPTFVPEGVPVWSPTGDRIAFTSTRTSTSQVYVVARDGGTAVQLTHEATGAFDPTWTSDGAVLYTSMRGAPLIMTVPASGGAEATAFASHPAGLGEAVCGNDVCLAVVDPLGAARAVAVIGAKVGVREVLSGSSAHHPTVLDR